MTTKTVEIPTEAELEAALRSLWEGKEQVEEMMSRLLAIEPTVDDEFIAAVREGRDDERVSELARKPTLADIGAVFLFSHSLELVSAELAGEARKATSILYRYDDERERPARDA